LQPPRFQAFFGRQIDLRISQSEIQGCERSHGQSCQLCSRSLSSLGPSSHSFPLSSVVPDQYRCPEISFIRPGIGSSRHLVRGERLDAALFVEFRALIGVQNCRPRGARGTSHSVYIIAYLDALGEGEVSNTHSCVLLRTSHTEEKSCSPACTHRYTHSKKTRLGRTDAHTLSLYLSRKHT